MCFGEPSSADETTGSQAAVRPDHDVMVLRGKEVGSRLMLVGLQVESDQNKR